MDLFWTSNQLVNVGLPAGISFLCESQDKLEHVESYYGNLYCLCPVNLPWVF